MIGKIGLLAICSALILIPIHFEAFALTSDSYKFTKIDGKAIQNSPAAQSILQKIEESKKILADLQSHKPIVTEQQKFVEEQRALAKANLAQDMESMNKKYEGLTPKNSFATFVSKINGTSQQSLYWDQFNYMDAKIKTALDAKNSILQNGGTHRVAQEAFTKHASLTRTNMVKFVSDANIRHGLTDSQFQSYFDKNGKLPRFEDGDSAPCYECDRFTPIANKMIADSLDAKPKQS